MKKQNLPYKILGTTEADEPKFIKRLVDGDAGVVVGRVGGRIIAQFIVRGTFAIAESLEGESFNYITEQQYNKTTSEEVMAKRKKNEEEEHVNEQSAPAEKKEATEEYKGKKNSIKEEKKAAINGDKVEIRAALNTTTEKKLLAHAKKLKVDVAKYDHLNGGLKKMSVVNAVLGAFVKLIKEGKKTKDEILAGI